MDNGARWRVETLGARQAGSVMSGGSIAGSGAVAAALCKAMETKDGRVLGVMAAGACGRSPALAGYLWLARLTYDAEIQALGVKPDYRGRGVGDALVRAACEAAERWQSERLLLEVRAGNAAAIALYKRQGFGVDGRRRGYYPPLAAGSGREDALLMSRAVGT
ncbi:GNAT family N-acetyltransferase [Halomonas piscis]|uniref:GNAT family N-acetyltransferase n=1 Tax=Halomonas piscis TaxID=3031727 RepID=A0ABY9Z120_9GAMM|nr:GNAT family N-acetyltransferase [Halomonas piscis]WNK20737.1 GNAT family N-acetyltransferase [Halomonas piscis]